MTKELGVFEEQVLSIVAMLGDDVYGKSVVDAFKEQLQKEVNLSSVHVTLYRLQDKGLVKSRMGGATNDRGGRRKRLFTITNSGLATLQQMKDARESLWKFIPRLKMLG